MPLPSLHGKPVRRNEGQPLVERQVVNDRNRIALARGQWHIEVLLFASANQPRTSKWIP
ncbi:hypothetical protein [Bremerella sp.]|uniref:hypothetical protein n=1 Tax=Bremerella sp. TaxID=2795602 RepID=UPI003919EB5A